MAQIDKIFVASNYIMSILVPLESRGWMRGTSRLRVVQFIFSNLLILSKYLLPSCTTPLPLNNSRNPQVLTILWERINHQHTSATLHIITVPHPMADCDETSHRDWGDKNCHFKISLFYLFYYFLFKGST